MRLNELEIDDVSSETLYDLHECLMKLQATLADAGSETQEGMSILQSHEEVRMAANTIDNVMRHRVSDEEWGNHIDKVQLWFQGRNF